MIDPPPRFYRPNVGLMLIAPDRRVFVGRRLNQPDAWQMPQGGVDKGETPVEAACRELAEEVGTTRALLLRETKGWIAYDVPESLRPPHWKDKWRGQAQKWYALRFTGKDSEIDIHTPGGGKHKAEFIEWRWEPMKNLPDLVIPFKRAVYEKVVDAFAHLVKK